MSKTWVLVADRSRARLLNYQGRKSGLEEREDLVMPEGRQQSRDIMADRAGSRSDHGGPGVHAMQPRTDPRDTESENFARLLAQRLETALDAGDLVRLVLVAPPRFLGALRAALPERIRRLVAAEIDKELTQATLADIYQHVIDRL